MKVIITGGAGYIGSTVASIFKDEGHSPIIVDSLVTGYEPFSLRHEFHHCDISDFSRLARIKEFHPDCDTLIHCAARIVVSESMRDPFLYFEENVAKAMRLFENCVKLGIKRILFSSSASVYGMTSKVEVGEDTACNPASPYAETKYMVEKLLRQIHVSYGLSVVNLRYFNPIGADPELRTGPYVRNPSHLLGKLLDSHLADKPFTVFGSDWPTRDGSCIRDFIHIWDLARAHLEAVKYLAIIPDTSPVFETVNVGTGRGTTVLEFIEMFERVTGKKLRVHRAGRREGDVAGSYALTHKAHTLLNWKPKLSIEQGIESALAWRSQLENTLKYPS